MKEEEFLIEFEELCSFTFSVSSPHEYLAIFFTIGPPADAGLPLVEAARSSRRGASEPSHCKSSCNDTRIHMWIGSGNVWIWKISMLLLERCSF